jgi:hypothetical protein
MHPFGNDLEFSRFQAAFGSRTKKVLSCQYPSEECISLCMFNILIELPLARQKVDNPLL